MLQEAVDAYIASLSSREDEGGRSNHNTMAAYRNDLNQLCTYLKQQEIDNWPRVTREHITGYILEMRESQAYRPTTIARKIAAFKSFFRYMRNQGHIASDPVEKLEAPHVQKELPGVLSAEQISSLFRHMEVETPAGQRDLPRLHMLYAPGMRVTELVSLSMADFDATRATVVCPGRNGRNRRERVSPLSPIPSNAASDII